jgi:kynurenine formamidase
MENKEPELDAIEQHEHDSRENYEQEDAPRHHEACFEDLSLVVSRRYPCNFPNPSLPSLVVAPFLRRGGEPFASEAVLIDEHTGTHFDAPNHFIPPPSTALPNATPFGDVPSHQLPIWQFVSEACVIDVTDFVDKQVPPPAENLIPRQVVLDWEAQNRKLGPGDAVLFYTGYSDRFYKPLPGGRRYVHEPMEGKAPAWPAIDPDCIAYLVTPGQRVDSVGIDTPNIGPPSPTAVAVHLAGLSQGVIYTENLIRLGTLPATGSLYVLLGSKHASGSGGEARAFAVKPCEANPELAARLIRHARNQQVVDLTVLLSPDLPVTWPGHRKASAPPPPIPPIPTYRMTYLANTLHTWDQPGGPALVRGHLLDSHTGTHLVPPSYALPEEGYDPDRLDAETRKSLEEFESAYGAIGTSSVTAEQVHISRLCGRARIIDVQHLCGTAGNGKSPVIHPAHVHHYETQYGPLRHNDIVIFHSGYTDRFFAPSPPGDRFINLPLSGLAEGWPAPDAKTIFYLHHRGIHCVGTDAPRMGGVEAGKALWTYWAAAKRGMSFIENLTHVGDLPMRGAFFLFAPVKIKGSHGGHGRAIGLF